MVMPTQMRNTPRMNHQKDVGSTSDKITITPAQAKMRPIVFECRRIPSPPVEKPSAPVYALEGENVPDKRKTAAAIKAAAKETI